MIALQYCVGLCHTSTWISHRWLYVLSFMNIPLILHPAWRVLRDNLLHASLLASGRFFFFFFFCSLGPLWLVRVSLCHMHMAFSWCPNFPFLQGHLTCWIRGPTLLHYDLLLTNYICSDVTDKHGHNMKYWELGLWHMNFEGLTIQPVTSSNILYVFFIMLVVCVFSVKILAARRANVSLPILAKQWIDNWNVNSLKTENSSVLDCWITFT